MSERRRPFRRGRRSRPSGHQPQTPFPESYGDVDPYLDTMDSTTTPTPPPDAAQLPNARDNMTSPAIPTSPTTPAPSPSPSASSTPGTSDPNSIAGAPTNGSENSGVDTTPQSQQQSSYNPQSMGG